MGNIHHSSFTPESLHAKTNYNPKTDFQDIFLLFRKNNSMFKPWTTFLFELIQYFAFTFTAKQFVRPHLQLHAYTCFHTANPSTTHIESTWHGCTTKVSSNSHKITIFCSLSSSRKLEYFMEFQIYKNLPPPQQWNVKHCPVCYWVARKVTQHHQLHNLPIYHLPSPTTFLPVLISPTSLNLKNSSFTRVGEVG